MVWSSYLTVYKPDTLSASKKRDVHDSKTGQHVAGHHGQGEVWCRHSARPRRHVTSNMILSQPMEWSAEPSAERSAQKESNPHCANVMCKVRRTPEGDRSTDAMAAIASGASSATPKWVPHTSAPPLSSQLERWRLLWRRRWCQRSTGPRHFFSSKGTHRTCSFSAIQWTIGLHYDAFQHGQADGA